MTPKDLDRILASEEPLVPSSGFVASVMEGVRETASAPPPLPFPWRRYLLGLLAVLALSVVCGVLAVRLGLTAALAAAPADPALLRALAEAGIAFAGTYLLARLVLDLAGEPS